MSINHDLSCKRKEKLVVAVLGAAFLQACSSGGGSDQDTGDDGNEVFFEPPVPFFEKPFDADFPVGNLFDHDLPFQFVDVNGYAVDHEGVKRNIGDPGAGTDGHEGHDWIIAEGTDLKAVADGEVVTAGETTFFCPPLSTDVTQKDVQIQHVASNGDYYLSRYSHLATIAVSVGDTINAGEILGTSGNTGCSTTPHLHFQALWWSRERMQWITVDPYGWTSTSDDPWAAYPDGAISHPLWKAGQAPTLVTL